MDTVASFCFENIIVPVYSVLVVGFIIVYNYRSKKAIIAQEQAQEHIIKYIRSKSRNLRSNSADWKEIMSGVWRQRDAENFDAYLEFSGQTYLRRKLASVVFFKVRNTIKFSPGRLGLIRDFGEGVKTLDMDLCLGTSEETAEPARYKIDTGETYIFKAWVDEENKALFVKQIPLDESDVGLVNLHKRTMIDANNIRMEWDGFNTKTQQSCQMTSYFIRIA